MKILNRENVFFIEDHDYKEVKLSYTLDNLKKQLKKDKLYPFLIDNKNKISSLFAKIRLLKVNKNKMIVEIILFDTEHKDKFLEVARDIGFAVNPLFAPNNELVALGITPYPSELDN